MAKLAYHGKNGDPVLDRERIENLRLQNEINRSKLRKLNGDVVDKREVTFMLEQTLALLRTQILTVPQLVSAELRGSLDNTQAHAIRMRVEKAIHGFLEQLAENMERAIRSDEFIAELERNLAGNGHDDDLAKFKQDLAKRKRTEKRNEKRKST